MRVRLAVGNEGFPDMIRGGFYYVDKTAAVKPLMESGRYIQLITRPRRFGKTLFMGMLRAFLEISLEKPGDSSQQKSLFAGLKILEEKDFCERYMGQCPVISISLRTMKGLSFESAMRSLAEVLQPVAEQFSQLIESPRLTQDDRIFLERCQYREHLLNPANQADLRVFLSKMSVILARHFERQTVLLIDEYDVPLQKAVKGGYYPQMLEFLQDFLACLKPGEDLRIGGRHAVQKAVLTGCLRVSKASIFTDVNNFTVNSVCIQGGPLAEAMGFTAAEAGELLRHCGLEAKSALVREWYDGYRIGNAEIYSPWDLIHFCADALDGTIDPDAGEPENYWIDTSSNDVIDEFLGFLTPDDADRMQTLLDGGEIALNVNHQLTYGDFQSHKSRDFWTLLLFTGYLTISSRIDSKNFLVRIPNKEIRDTFEERVRNRFSEDNETHVHDGEAAGRASFTGSAETMQMLLSKFLERYVSVRDAATRAKAENFYQGFLIGLFGSAKNVIKNFRSNCEAGSGYADIIYTSEGGRIGVVIEIKHASDMKNAAQEALVQIREKHYAQALSCYNCSQVYAYGIAFSGKACVVLGELVDET